MGLLDQAITVARCKKNAQDEANRDASLKRGTEAAEWLTAHFGLDATYVRAVADVTYERRTDRFGLSRWEKETRHRYQVQVDDVLLGLSYSRLWDKHYEPKIDVMYVTCPSCQTSHGYGTGYVSARRDVEQNRQRLLAQIGRVAMGDWWCTQCKAQPCQECGRPR